MRETLDITERDLEGLFERYRRSPESRVFVMLADACRKTDRIDEALEICRRGLRRHPEYASGYVVKGKCLYDLKRHEDAQRAFETVLDFDADNLVALKYLGMMEALAGRFDSARKYLKHILQIDPENPEITEALKHVEQRQGDERRQGEERRQSAERRQSEERRQSAERRQGERRQTDEERGQGEERRHGDERRRSNERRRSSERRQDEGEQEGRRKVDDEVGVSDELATITLADIYASQGYKDRALRIYEEVLTRQPHNETVRGKITALTGGPSGTGAAGTGRRSSITVDADDDTIEHAEWNGEMGRVEDQEAVGTAETDEEVLPGQAESKQDSETRAARARSGKTQFDDGKSIDHFKQWLEGLRK